jgi:hypothetical protein
MENPSLLIPTRQPARQRQPDNLFTCLPDNLFICAIRAIGGHLPLVATGRAGPLRENFHSWRWLSQRFCMARFAKMELMRLIRFAPH